MEREILYLEVPSFPVAVEQIRNPGLRGRPVVICPAGPGRGLLRAVSPEARCEGLMPGLPRRLARRSCPGLRILAPDPDLYRRAGRALFHVLGAYSPLVEPVRPGALFLDPKKDTKPYPWI